MMLGHLKSDIPNSATYTRLFWKSMQSYLIFLANLSLSSKLTVSNSESYFFKSFAEAYVSEQILEEIHRLESFSNSICTTQAQFVSLQLKLQKLRFFHWEFEIFIMSMIKHGSLLRSLIWSLLQGSMLTWQMSIFLGRTKSKKTKHMQL